MFSAAKLLLTGFTQTKYHFETETPTFQELPTDVKL